MDFNEYSLEKNFKTLKKCSLKLSLKIILKMVAQIFCKIDQNLAYFKQGIVRK